MMIALGGAVVSARGFAGAVTRPLEQLVTVVRGVSASSTATMPAVIAADPPAEIAELLDDVNHMQSRLADSYQQLEQALAQGEHLNVELRDLTKDLDKKVQIRTAELSAAKQIANPLRLSRASLSPLHRSRARSIDPYFFFSHCPKSASRILSWGSGISFWSKVQKK